jgi:hypothetical protein
MEAAILVAVRSSLTSHSNWAEEAVRGVRAIRPALRIVLDMQVLIYERHF